MISIQDSGTPNINELYKEVILDHFSNPRNAHPLDHPTVSTEGHNPVCGDEIHLTLTIDSTGKITQIGATTQGCSISVASTSIMAEELEGKSLQEAEKYICRFKRMMGGGDIIESESGDFEALAGVKKFPVRIKCALLSWMTLEQAITQYRGGKTRIVSTEEGESL